MLIINSKTTSGVVHIFLYTKECKGPIQSILIITRRKAFGPEVACSMGVVGQQKTPLANPSVGVDDDMYTKRIFTLGGNSNPTTHCRCIK
jgi:hypothetical protein